MKQFFCLCIALLVAVCSYGQASTLGKDFWLSFGNNLDKSIHEVSLQIRIVTTKNTQATITFTETGEVIPLSLTANTVYTHDLTNAQKQAVYSYETGKTSKSIHIQTGENVSVYAINLSQYTTDATAILPVGSLGNSYYHLSYSPVEYYTEDGYTIVAVEDNTTIYQDGAVVEVLNKGEVYSSYFDKDVSGKHITTNYPVAYFVTNSCVMIPVGVWACDCFYQQLYAESLWGNRFFVPVTIRGKERVRIIASRNNTVIDLTGGTIIKGSLTLNVGEWVEIEINAAENGCYIETNNPVGVASYLMGIENTGLSYAMGDPSMTWIPPIDQSINEALIAPFLAKDLFSILTEHHLLIVAPTDAKDQTEISEGGGSYTALTGGTWHDHSSGYSYYTLPLSKSDVGYSLKNPKGLIILGYGLGEAESYYYIAGSATRKLNGYFEVNGIHYQSLDGGVICTGNIKVEVSKEYPMDPAPGRLRWILNDVEQTAFTDKLSWQKQFPIGNYSILMIARDQYGKLDSLTTSFAVGREDYITMRDTICQYESYNERGFELPAQDVPGNHTYLQKLTNVYGCDSVMTLYLTVKPEYEKSFTARVPINEPYIGNGFFIPPHPTPGFHTFVNTFDCNSTETLHLTVYEDIVPDVHFSPNGDGVKDVWNIKNIEYFEVESVEIYDRYGKRVMRCTDQFTPWDGTYQGKKLPSTDYWYVITLKEVGKQYVGHFTLLR